MSSIKSNQIIVYTKIYNPFVKLKSLYILCKAQHHYQSEAVEFHPHFISNIMLFLMLQHKPMFRYQYSFF